jgi:hypothetical protein
VSSAPANRVLWFAVLGGAAAWVAQFIANLAFTFAQCQQPAPRWSLPVHSWEVGLSIVALAIAVTAELVSLRLFRRTYRIDHVAAQERHGEGAHPPIGRVNFLSIIGLVVNFLALTIILMTMIGAPLLPVCQQS